jgi:hypothetical protein
MPKEPNIPNNSLAGLAHLASLADFQGLMKWQTIF